MVASGGDAAAARRSCVGVRRALLLLAGETVDAITLYMDMGASLDDLNEAVTTLEDAGRIGRRVLGGAHPVTKGIESDARNARVALRARETPGSA